jgi:hypothetical protein
MGTASAASPKLSGHLTTRMLLILLPCSLTSHSKGASRTRKKQIMQLGVTITMDLRLLEAKNTSYVHVMNHSMELINADHMQIFLVIRSPCKTGRTCWLTGRMWTSQSQSLKYGESNSKTDKNETQRKRQTKTEIDKNIERSERQLTLLLLF